MKSCLPLLLTATAFVSEASAWQTPFPGPGPTAQPQSPAIHTSRTAFRIPFQHDPREIARLGSGEVRLYVSRDRGRQWFPMQSVQPQAARFDFRAEADGEYWFAVRTVDHQGQEHPGGEKQPGLVVAVDTRKPVLKIDLTQNGPGRVALSWVAVDDHVDPASVRLEFSQSGLPGWQPVGMRAAASGQTEWTVPAGGTVAVRGVARDRAGNETSAQYQIQVAPAVAGGTLPGGAPNPLRPGPTGFDPTSGVPGTLPVPAQPLGPVSPGANGLVLNNVPPGPGTPGIPADDGTGVPAGPWSGSPNPLAPSGPFSAVQPNPVSPPPAGDPNAWRDAFANAIPGTGSAPQDFTAPEDSGHRKVRSRFFEIDYELNDVGPSGIAAVELFVTQNGGEKWYRYGIDEDRQSPFDVEVPDDGVYGFAMRVVSGAGLTDPPPQPGQTPDIVIEVDASPPVVQLFPLKQGTGAHSNRILVSWQAEDYKLADRPIALSWSSTPEGPWKLISDWLPNSGEYVWTVPRGIPPRLYLRVVARDAIGNMARVDTPQPVLVDLSRPNARIVNVETSRQTQ